jgi:hypothetical protein
METKRPTQSILSSSLTKHGHVLQDALDMLTFAPGVNAVDELGELVDVRAHSRTASNELYHLAALPAVASLLVSVFAGSPTVLGQACFASWNSVAVFLTRARMTLSCC